MTQHDDLKYNEKSTDHKIHPCHYQKILILSHEFLKFSMECSIVTFVLTKIAIYFIMKPNPLYYFLCKQVTRIRLFVTIDPFFSTSSELIFQTNLSAPLYV